MEDNTKAMSSEDFSQMIEGQSSQAEQEISAVLDELSKKYHIVAVANAVGRLADMLHVGWGNGYDAAITDVVVDMMDRIRRNAIHKTDTNEDIEEQVRQSLSEPGLSDEAVELFDKMTKDVREGILSPEEIADKYVAASKEEYRQSVIDKIKELRARTESE